MAPPRITQHDYEALAAFRTALRRFTSFSEAAARAQGLTPQQHQALLVIKGTPEGRAPSIGEIARHLLLRPNSAVELVDRLEAAGLVRRESDPGSARRMLVVTTEAGERALAALSEAHLKELREIRPALTALLARL